MRKIVKCISLGTLVIALWTLLASCQESHQHVYSERVVPATCMEGGYTEYRCECGDHYRDKETKALGHDYKTDEIPAKCGVDGKITYTCSRGDSTYSETIPALNHSWDKGEIIEEATCSKEGTMLYTCTHDASHTYTESISVTDNHAWDEGEITVPATCTSNGIKIYTCQTNKTHTREEIVPMLGHDLHTEDVPATCTSYGCKETTCSRCDYRESEPNYNLPPLEHSWDEGEVIVSSTCTTKGVMKFTCTRDASHIYTEEIDYTDHTFLNHSGKCTVCNSVDYFSQGLEYDYIPSDETYIIVGIGRCEDSILTIPSYYRGKKVKAIGFSAFMDVDSIEEIYIPETIGILSENSFKNCSNLRRVVIGHDTHILENCELTEIGRSAFEGCTALEDIYLPKSITKIGNTAFAQCTNLKNVFYKSDRANDWIKIKFGTMESNPIYLAQSFQTWQPSILGFGAPEEINLVFSSPTKIEDYAFVGLKNIKRITISNAIIGECAFEGVQAEYTLRDIISIGRNAFRRTNFRGVSFGKSLTYLGDGAFAECEDLEEVTLPSSLKEIGTSPFSSSFNLVTATVPQNALSALPYTIQYLTILDETIEKTCSHILNLKCLYLDKDIKTIGEDVFKDCKFLKDVYYYGTIEDWCGIQFANEYANPMAYASHIFMNVSNQTGMVEFGDELTSLEIPDSISTIGQYQFYGFDSITSAVLPSNLSNVSTQAFKECSCLVELYNLSSLPIVKGAETYGYVGYYAAVIYSSLEEESKILKIEDYIFLKEEEEYSLVRYAGTSSIAVLPEYVEGNAYKISENAFINSSVVSIEIPNTVTCIERRALKNLNSLENITIPFVGVSLNGTENTHFGYIFGASSYDDNSRYVPSSLKEVIITGGDSIGDSAFFYCSNLTSVVIPNSVISIGSNTFRGCSSLTSINIPNSVISIGSNAFYECSSLQYNEYDNGLYLGNNDNLYLWLISVKNTSITECEINENAKFIHSSAFRGCSSLTSVVIPDNVTSIGNGAFTGCSNLTSITIPFVGESLNGTENTYFGYIFGARPSSYDSMYVPSSLKEVIITGCESIGDSAFYYCSNLTSVTIGNSVTSIGESTFSSCSSLTSVVISDSVTSIGRYAFYDCSNLTSVTIPNSVTSIGEATFSGCSSLTSIVIPNSVTSIERSALEYCRKLNNVYYGGTLEDWKNISISSYNTALTSATCYYYSETEPTESGTYWHYVDDVPTIWN